MARNSGSGHHGKLRGFICSTELSSSLKSPKILARCHMNPMDLFPPNSASSGRNTIESRLFKSRDSLDSTTENNDNNNPYSYCFWPSRRLGFSVSALGCPHVVQSCLDMLNSFPTVWMKNPERCYCSNTGATGTSESVSVPTEPHLQASIMM